MKASAARAFGEPVDLPIVVGVDGSEPSMRAVEWAADEAALRGASLRLVYASLWERYEGASFAHDLGKPSEEVMAEDIVETAERRARQRQPGVKVTTDVLPEEAGYGLIRETHSALAMVLGCRGRSGVTEALLGSVSVTVAGHAHCPLVVVRGSHDNRSGARGRIVLGVSERQAGSAAVRFAVEEALLREVPLEAVRAWRRPLHEPRPHPLIVGEPAHLQERQAAETVEEALRDTPAGLQVHRRTSRASPATPCWRCPVKATCWSSAPGAARVTSGSNSAASPTGCSTTRPARWPWYRSLPELAPHGRRSPLCPLCRHRSTSPITAPPHGQGGLDDPALGPASGMGPAVRHRGGRRDTAAVDRLVRTPRTGLHGPADLTWPQAAAIVSAATGRPVRVERVGDDAMRKLLRVSGMTDGLVEAVVGMSTGLRDGFVPEQPRTPYTTTPTTLAAWAYDLLRPPAVTASGTGAG